MVEKAFETIRRKIDNHYEDDFFEKEGGGIVDLVTLGALHPALKEEILGEAVHVA